MPASGPGILDVIAFVSQLAPQLVEDAHALGGLFSQAGAAIDNASATGQIQDEDWAALRGMEASLRATLDAEVGLAAGG